MKLAQRYCDNPEEKEEIQLKIEKT